MNRLIIEKTRSASGDIVNIQDGAAGQNIPSLLVDLQPTQDLNGYSNPWPGGGGKNKLQVIGSTGSNNGVVYTFNADGTVTLSNTATATSVKAINSSFSLPSGTYILTGGINENIYIFVRINGSTYYNDKGSGVTFTVVDTDSLDCRIQVKSGVTASGTIKPMIRLSGTEAGFAPYSNICPITGRTEANAYVAGKNLFDGIVTEGKYLSNNGTTIYSTAGMSYTDYIRVKPNTTYYVYGIAGYNQYAGVLIYNSSKTPIGRYLGVASTGITYRIFTTPADCYFVRINFVLSSVGESAILAISDEAVAYTPFVASNVYNVDWSGDAGTVYGGTIDFVSGKLTVTHKYITGNSTNISRTGVANWQIAHSHISDSEVPNANLGIVSDMFKSVTTPTAGGAFLNIYGGIRFTTNDDYTDAATLITALGATPSFVYPLATPIVYQLTPQEIQTLGGINNIFSDAGAISIIYNADEEIEDTLMSGNCLLTNAMVGDELSIDELDFTILLSNGLALYDSDNEELLDANGDQLYVQSLGAVKYGTRIDYYIDSDMVGRFYVDSAKRVGPTKYAFSCVSAVGLLDKMAHNGGIYQGVLAGDIFSDIMGAIPYTIDDAVANTPVYGWLPRGTCRDNLHALMFALGASVTKDSGVLHFLFLDEPITNITDDRVYLEGSVEDITQASLVNVTEHAFVALADDETITLFDNTDGGTAANSVFVSFDDPMHDLSADGLTIEESGVNYAIVSGVGTLTGQVYTHTTSVISKENPAAVYEHVISCDENFLVSAVNSSNVVNRLYNYYVNAQEVEGRLVVGAERPGARLNIKSIYGEYVTGYLKSIDITMSNTIAAQFALAAGWYPGYFGNNYNNVIIASSSGSITIPAGVTKARLVLIGGGQGGASGLKGEDGEDSTMSDFNEKGEQGDGGAGGAGGNGGHGGKVYDTGEIDVTPGTYTLVVGSGGAGGTYSATQSNQGSEGGDTTLLGYSSANGYVLGSGYLDVINGDRYAMYGEDGIPGGDGGAGSDAYNVLSEAGGDVDIYTGGAGSLGVYKDFSDDTWKAGSGSGGGGAAYGNNGANGNPPTIDAYGIPQVLADGGDGGAATTPTDALAYGQGGRGGHGGGGGGGAGGGASTGGRSFLQGHGGTGGAGSDGENGANGCAFIFY